MLQTPNLEKPLDEEMPDVETSTDAYAQRFSGEVGKWLLSVQEETTLDLLKSRGFLRILDVGGGHGQLIRGFLDQGHHVTILGSAACCCARVQAFVDDQRCHFLHGNLLELPFSDREFDVVTSYRLLSHMQNWTKFVEEICRVAKHAVLVDYADTHSFNCLTPWLFSIKKKIEGNTRHYHCFKKEELMQAFESHGFTLQNRCPEFFLPMAIHRVLKFPTLSRVLEKGFRTLGLTDSWGSPVIMKLIRDEV
ncbi:MAG: class I SAM-dependent methyltransferase [Nitrospirales bacterium]|nr:class I SAM-dependent methyltransferase [Nitrospira sp.]MDR4500074.1 class I SAM-dependent methyltransferase [Nitrospirales bacterium]